MEVMSEGLHDGLHSLPSYRCLQTHYLFCGRHMPLGAPFDELQREERQLVRRCPCDACTGHDEGSASTRVERGSGVDEEFLSRIGGTPSRSRQKEGCPRSQKEGCQGGQEEAAGCQEEAVGCQDKLWQTTTKRLLLSVHLLQLHSNVRTCLPPLELQAPWNGKKATRERPGIQKK